MNLALTSDFPSTDNPAVVEAIRSRSDRPRIAWIPPVSDLGGKRLALARERFASYGLPDLEYCDIDGQADKEQLDRIMEYDVIYLTGGDPIVFRRNILEIGLHQRLQEYIDAGGFVVAASGGAMQVTKNVSLFRLETCPLAEVVAHHAEFESLGIVGYELLPHLNRLEPSFVETVRRYSEYLSHDVIALADGAAVLHSAAGQSVCGGRAVRFRQGVVSPLGSAA